MGISLDKATIKTGYSQDHALLCIVSKCIGVTPIDVIIVAFCSATLQTKVALDALVLKLSCSYRFIDASNKKRNKIAPP